jgi:hypothetical protein
MEFIVGAWYKYGGCYIKFKEVKNDIFVASDDIFHGRYDGRGGCYGMIRENVYTLLTDLSKIQQYLPLNHPDLFNTQIYTEDYKYLIQFLKEHGIQ